MKFSKAFDAALRRGFIVSPILPGKVRDAFGSEAIFYVGGTIILEGHGAGGDAVSVALGIDLCMATIASFKGLPIPRHEKIFSYSADMVPLL